jgi:hypothetical protein
MDANLQAQRTRPQASAAPRRYDGANGNPLYDPGNGGHYGTSLLPSIVATRFIVPRHLPFEIGVLIVLSQAPPLLYVPTLRASFVLGFCRC